MAERHFVNAHWRAAVEASRYRESAARAEEGNNGILIRLIFKGKATEISRNRTDVYISTMNCKVTTDKASERLDDACTFANFNLLNFCISVRHVI